MGKQGLCCDEKVGELAQLQGYRKVLWVVFLINLLMFFLEFVFGFISGSTALEADSLDMLGDAFIYAISLYAVGRGATWNFSVSLLKGVVMILFAFLILADAINGFLVPRALNYKIIGGVAFLALIANLICGALLLRYRNDNLNMRSVWLCSRNDVLSNLGVLVAAGGVYASGSHYPDIIVGVLIAGIILVSSFEVIFKAIQGLLESKRLNKSV